MPEIKRPNYFNFQFLDENDFKVEQDYHLQMRRRHQRLAHTPGIAEGLQVTKVGTKQVQISAGMAVDRDGNEIVLTDPKTYTLVTGGNGAAVFLTIAYQEVKDAADRKTDGGVSDFIRTTERPKLEDSATAPPANSAALLLARIDLNADGIIESDAAIRNGVRIASGARLAPASVGTTALADGAVSFAKLAPNAVPSAVLVDSLGGSNRLVAQINAGTGTIDNARLETDMTTGVVIFSNLVTDQEQFTTEIDPGLGAPVRVDFAIDDLIATGFTTLSDTDFVRNVRVRIDISRATGAFAVVARRTSGPPGPIRVRWYAAKARTRPDLTHTVSLSVAPAAPTLPGNTAQVLTATVRGAYPGNVTWSGPEANGGTLTNIAANTVTYTSPGVSGTYHVTATSVQDPSKAVTIPIVVTAAITVLPAVTSASLITGRARDFTADVINTTNKNINWSLTPATGSGTLVPTPPGRVTYTAPATPGTYTLTATSAADANAKASVTITVAAVTITLSNNVTIDANATTTLSSTIGPDFLSDKTANWSVPMGQGSVSPATGVTTVYTAPNAGVTATITAVASADSSKTKTVTVTVNAPPPPPPPPPPPGKLISISENLVAENIAASLGQEAASQDPASTQADAPRAFIRPQKRVRTDVPPKSNK